MTTTATYSFDSVGDTLPTLRKHEKIAFNSKKINYSPKTPLTLSTDKKQLFVMNKNLKDAASDNLKNLILTNRGERVMQPDFGANLKSILAEYGTAGFETEAMARIKAAAQKYLSYVSLTTMQMQKLDSPPSSGLVSVAFTVGYSIPLASISEQYLTVIVNTIA